MSSALKGKGDKMASYVKRGNGYDIRCYCGTDVNGKRINKYKTWIPEKGMTPKQIERELQRKILEFESGTLLRYK